MNALLEILDEFGDNNVKLLTEEEMEEILVKYGNESFKVDFDEPFYEEFYSNKQVHYSSEEIEQILEEYENRTIDDIINEYATKSDKEDTKGRHRYRKRNRRRGERDKKKSKDNIDIKILQTN